MQEPSSTANQNHLQTFADMSLSLLSVVDTEGCFRWLNPRWSELLGWKLSELGEMRFVDLVHGGQVEQAVQALERVEAGEESVDFCARVRTRRGNYRTLAWRVFRAGNGDICYCGQQATPDEQQQRRLWTAERMAALGGLAAGIAHEVNNPLTYIWTNLELLSGMVEDLEEAGRVEGSTVVALKQAVVDAQHGAERATQIVANLSSFSTPDETSERLLEAPQIVNRAYELARSQLRYRARFATDFQSAPRILADEAELTQVLVNLLVNAAQALPDGHADTNQILVRVYDDDDHAVVEVCDTGPGLADDVAELVFKPFFTTRDAKMHQGLGLTTSRAIVRSWGGEILGSNAPSGGAMFRVTLPATKTERRSESTAITTTAASSILSRRVLLVDDEALICQSLATMLRRRSYSVRSASSGRQALEALQDDGTYDAIVCDVMMPEITGVDVQRWLADNRPELCPRVIFVTGNGLSEEAKRFINELPNQRLSKPFGIRDLCDTIEDVVAETSAVEIDDSCFNV
jgi:two-component system cell cycle sensor histidine kinase/response regulator CckA